MINKIQYTILILTVTTLISLGINNVYVPAAMAVDSQTSQEKQTHLTEVQKALDNNDIQGAKMHLSAAMGLLQNSG
jgi:hypothetical protein